MQGLVALTIDDGLCRHGAERTWWMLSQLCFARMAPTLRSSSAQSIWLASSMLLRNSSRKATSWAIIWQRTSTLSIPRLKPEAFDTALGAATSAIEAAAPGVKLRWFRAPQGIMTSTMAESVRQHGLKSALGDAYADDWAMAHNMAFVARTILQQATSGSIIILHQPEVGYREHTLTILQRFGRLDCGQPRAVTLSEMEALATSAKAAGGTATKARKSSTKRSVAGRFLVREVDVSESQVRSEAETGGSARI